MILRTWLLLGVASLILLFVCAYFNKVVVYRDYGDLGWSLSFAYSPILTYLILSFILQDEAEISYFITETIIGMSIFSIGAVITAISIFKIYINSINDNNLLLGIFIGTAKIIVAVIISVLAISLVRYLFRDERKLGHVAIFAILFGIFTWFLNTLINGEETNKVANNE